MNDSRRCELRLVTSEIVQLTAERFKTLAGGQQSATTGLLERLTIYPERVTEVLILVSRQDMHPMCCEPVARLTAATG